MQQNMSFSATLVSFKWLLVKSGTDFGVWGYCNLDYMMFKRRLILIWTLNSNWQQLHCHVCFMLSVIFGVVYIGSFNFLLYLLPKRLILFKLLAATSTSYATLSSSLLVNISPSLSHSAKTKFLPSLSQFSTRRISSFPQTHRRIAVCKPSMNLLNKLGFGSIRSPESMDSTIPQSPDDDIPAPGQQFAQFGAGCFWGVELAFQRVPGVSKTEVGYSQGYLHNPSYEDICSGATNHSEVVRIQYDPKACSYDTLLDLFWDKHDPTTLNRQVIWSSLFLL